MSVLALTRQLSRPARQGRAAIALPIVAFAVTTALLLVVTGGAHMFLVDPRALAADGAYGVLAVLALVLLSVPLVTLGAAAARLTSRRRVDRLATLRLLGASGRELWLLTVIEATLIAAAGAAFGIMLYAILLPFVTLLPFFGGPIGLAVVIEPLPGAIVLIGVVVIGAVSSAVGLRRVAVTPLGVRVRSSAPPTRRAALAIGAVLIAVVVLLGANMGVVMQLLGPAFGVAVLLAVFGGALTLLNVVGAPIIAARGRSMATRANTAAELIAGRELAAHPGPAWRRVSGMAIVSFIAVIAGSGLAILNMVESSDVSTSYMSDVRTGVLLTLGIAFALLACAVGVTQAASVLEDRDLIVGLDRLGIPDSQLARARRLTVMLPLRWAAVGGASLGAALALPLVGISVIVAPLAVLTIVATFVAGFALVRGGVASTRPIVTAIRRGAA